MASAIGAFILCSRIKWLCTARVGRKSCDLQLFGVVVIVVDEHDLAVVPVEQRSGDRCAVSAGAVDPQFAVGGNLGNPFRQLVQREVDRTAYMALIEFARLANIEHDDTVIIHHIGEVLEVGDAVVAQCPSVSQRADVPAGAAGEPIDADAGQFALGIGDLFGVLAYQGQRRAPCIKPAKVVDEGVG
jgi:hypothetical protein